MSSPHWLLILNGKAAGDDALREAVQTMRARGVTLAVRVTWERGDAARHVAEALEAGVDAIVCGGGDGTLNEVAAALAATDRPADALPSLGLVPMGTANDFATAAGIVDDPAQALALVATRPPVGVDMLCVEVGDAAPRWCINLASGGFGATITAQTGEGMKKMLGGLAYVLTGIARAGRIEPLPLRIDGPGFAWRGDFIALGVGNGRQAGGGQVLCPDARIDDGLLDLTIVPPLDGEVAATLGTVLSAGKAAALERLAVRQRLPWVALHSPDDMVLNLDGEPVEAARVRIACVPQRLRVHLPAQCPLLSPAPD